MSTHSNRKLRRAGARAKRPMGRIFALGAACLAMACATVSPFNQDFVELETPHFVLTSSLGEAATIELARNLEFFHAGVVDAMGLAGGPEAESSGPAAMPRTRVFAFDDRSVERPFAVRGEPTHILDQPEGMVWIFRAGRSFDERVSVEVRHQYAHQLLRDRSPSPRPLWYEEGVAQLAGTVEEAAGGVRIGRMVEAHRALLLDWRRNSLAAKMRKSNLSNETSPERRLFEAQSWAIAHTLRFAGDEPNSGDSALDQYRRALDEGGARAAENARKVLGVSDAILTERIYQHLERKRLRVRLVSVSGWDPEKVRTVQLSRAEGRARLGFLGLALGRPALAEEYFERALSEDSNHLLAQAGLAVVAAGEGRSEGLDQFASKTLAFGSEDPALQRHLGMAYQLLAQRAQGDAEREQRIENARDTLRQVLVALPRDVEARLKMGQLELFEGQGGTASERFEHAQRALEWFEAASALRPGALGIELEKARAEQAAGLTRAAEVRANEVISRSHSTALVAEARAILAEGAARE